MFTFTGEITAPLSLEIYDTQGRLIRTFATFTGGKAVITWAGDNADGVSVPDGAYFYKIRSGDQQMTGKFVRTH
jgi:flagellar hook assembly protein FlgD